ncbi:CPBP family intramembrane glutamic endopeptidase [Nonomuraea sp. NPDC050404]|uniref:CPBP family intramembrane glutamic endopeptidase n=1 Tax=Nonomuraea sp. NPDC050404 TaxID=3155783 RepID=UPI0034010056
MTINQTAGTTTPWRAVGAFVALAFGGAWVAMSPLLLSGFRRTEAAHDMTLLIQVCIAAMMLTPALAAFVVLRLIHRPASVRAAIGLVRPRPIGRLARESLLALAVPCLLQLLALGVAALAGTYRIDLADLSGFRAQFAPDTVGQTGLPVMELALWLGALVLHMVLWLPMFFGEELGWQGYLLPRLAPLGVWPAMACTALVFALWHLPTLIMGGQYPGHSPLTSVAYMIISTVLIVPIFAWLRMRSGSVWPAVLAHSFVSGAGVQLVWLFSDADHPIDPLQVGLNGWPGWIVMSAFVAFLGLTGRLRWANGAGPRSRA